MRNWRIKPAGPGFLRNLLFPVLAGLIIFIQPQAATADSIHGFLEYGYNNSIIKIKDVSGVASNIRSDGFRQRYNLAMDRLIYPSLMLTGGGLFEDNMQNGTNDGVDSKSETTRLSPYMDLSLNNPFLSSGVGYRRREDTAKSNGVSSPKQIQDIYTASLGWHPSDIPSMDVYYIKRYLYDETRTSRNIETDSYTWSADYRRFKGLDLNYSGSYNQLKDLLVNSETQNLTNSGRIAYSGSLMDKRVSYQTSYNIGVQESTVTSKGTATATIFTSQVAQQLSLVTNPVAPPTVTSGRLTAFQPLNLVIPQGQLPPAVATQNNFGLSYADPTDVGTLFLAVTSTTSGGANPGVASLDALSGQFVWDIYTSDDGGLTWQIPPAITGQLRVKVDHNPAMPGSEQVGFVFTFPGVKTRFIKVVGTPVKLLPQQFPADINPDSILAATLQSFSALQAAPGKSAKSSSIGGNFNMNVRALIRDNPNISYDMGFVFTHSKSDQTAMTTSYLVNNGLSIAQRFNDIWSGNGRLTEEFSLDSEGKIRNAISYNAGIAATPIHTLNHSLVYSGRTEFADGQTSINNSIYLNNSAQLYRGLSVLLGAGYSTASPGTGQDTDSVMLTVGADIVPNRNLTLSLSYQDQASKQSGGGKPDTSTFTRTATATASYRPFEAIYLTGGYILSMQNDRADETLQNYGVSWSPFRGGDLQFSFYYNESLSSTGNQKVKNLSPSLRWKIRPGATLDVSYSMQQTKSELSGSTDVRAVNAQLRIAF
ncbi:MAG: hypothetical protein WA140_05285 [Geobacteraceae bacterium]